MKFIVGEERMKAQKIINWILSLVLSIIMLSQLTIAAPDLGENYLNQYFNGSILVAKEGEILLRKGYGKADFKKRIPNTPATVFRLASVTKQFTAMAILILKEKGKLSVNDPLSKYIPDYPDGDKITIHNLLTHTSGIAEYFRDELISWNHYYSLEELISLFKDNAQNFIPGERFQYCNSNYILLGYIIEKVSGIEYGNFVQQFIFTPLDMENSGYEGRKTKFKNLAVGYYSIKPKPVEAFNFNMSIIYSAGGLCSTIDDLYKWDQALYTEKLVKSETLKKMFTPYSQAINYGYGWSGWINETSTFDIMEHTGSFSGFSSYIYRDIRNQIFIIMLSNSNEGFKYISGYLKMIQL